MAKCTTAAREVVESVFLGVFQETCRCGTKEQGLVGNAGVRRTVGLDNFRGLFQPL